MQPPAQMEPPDPANAEPPSAGGFEQFSVQGVQHVPEPLPAPEALARYEAARAASSNRIMAMAAEHAERQRAIESRIAAELSGVERRGQGFAVIVVQVAIVAATGLVFLSEDGSRLATFLAGIAGGGIAFVVGRYQDAEKRRQTRTDFASVQLESPHDDTPPETDHPLHPNSHVPLGT